MKTEKSKAATVGTALKELCICITIVFCGLRASDVIEWHWFWVLSPIIIAESVGILLLAICGIALSLSKDNR